MSSAEVVEVAAKNKTIKTAVVADGAGRPALTSSGRRTCMQGSSRSATAARPRVTENMNGIANLSPNRGFA